MSLSYLNSFYCQWDCHVEYITHWVSYCIHYSHNEFVSTQGIWFCFSQNSCFWCSLISLSIEQHVLTLAFLGHHQVSPFFVCGSLSTFCNATYSRCLFHMWLKWAPTICSIAESRKASTYKERRDLMMTQKWKGRNMLSYTN